MTTRDDMILCYVAVDGTLRVITVKVRVLNELALTKTTLTVSGKFEGYLTYVTNGEREILLSLHSNFVISII